MYRQCYRCHAPATQRAPQDPHPTDFGHRAAHTYLRHQTCPSRYLPNIVNRSADSVVRCAQGTLRARHVRCSLRGKQIARGRGPVGTSEYTRARRPRSPNTMKRHRWGWPRGGAPISYHGDSSSVRLYGERAHERRPCCACVGPSEDRFVWQFVFPNLDNIRVLHFFVTDVFGTCAETKVKTKTHVYGERNCSGKFGCMQNGCSLARCLSCKR